MTDKRIYTLSFLAIALFCLAFQSQQKPFEILKQRFEDGNVLHADFRYEYEDTFTNQTSANFGKLWISNKQYKVISGEQTIYVDGETSKVYDANRNRVIISKYVEQDDDFAPSRFLNGIDSSYTVVNQAKSKNGFAVELKSQDPFSLYKKITIKVDKQYVPAQIIAIDQSGNIITTSFINASFIKNRQANFYIKYPDEAKVVDLRK